MCGLAGYIDPNISDAELQVFKDLMYVTQFRGHHSSGVAAVYKPGYNASEGTGVETRVAKVVGPVSNLIYSPLFGQITNNPGVNRLRSALFGHCRAATRGSVSPTNAHPFVTTNLVGVHNGTITSGITIPDGETDSQALFESIDEKGLIETLKNVVGAYALIFFDKRDNTINIIRNNDRTLFYGKRGSAVVISSEKPMLEFIGARGVQITGITAFEPFHLYKRKITEGYTTYGTSSFEVVDYSKELRAFGGTHVVHNNFRSWGSGYGIYGYESEESGSAPWSAPVSKREETSKEVRAIREDAFTTLKPRGMGVYVQKATYDRWLSDGCSICGCIPNSTDYTYWASHGHGVVDYICESCVNAHITDNDAIVSSTFPYVTEDYFDYKDNLNAAC